MNEEKTHFVITGNITDSEINKNGHRIVKGLNIQGASLVLEHGKVKYNEHVHISPESGLDQTTKCHTEHDMAVTLQHFIDEMPPYAQGIMDIVKLLPVKSKCKLPLSHQIWDVLNKFPNLVRQARKELQDK